MIRKSIPRTALDSTEVEILLLTRPHLEPPTDLSWKAKTFFPQNVREK